MSRTHLPFFSRKALILTLIIAPLLSLAFWQPNSRVSATPHLVYENLEIFANVLSIVQEHYVETIDSTEVIQGALRGMLSTLDPHSSYLQPEDFKELQAETTGSFSGIGIELTQQDAVLTVVSPIEGTPAAAAGLHAGDKIIMIDGDSTKDMTIMEAIRKLRGPKGSQVTISIHRDGWNEPRQFTITRADIPLHSVNTRMIEPGYGYLRISSFQTKTSTDLEQALDELLAGGEMKGMILDLRNNPGGLLDQAVKVADFFLDEGVIVTTKGRIEEQNMTFKARDNGDRYNFPLVVLVNEGSASASEIVAGALKDHGRALILGVRTFGKGSVQTIIPLHDGAGLRLTTARYYTPDGTSIQARGITPDIEVAGQPAGNGQEDSGERGEHKITREKDLKRHILNDDEKGYEEPRTNQPQPLSGPAFNGREEENGGDYQLHTALMILKGVHVFNGEGKGN